jgi:polyisoprenoid-binding protein YceI
MFRAIALFVLALAAAVPAAGATWRLDPATRIAVDVDWQGRSVELRFPTFSGEIAFDERRPERAAARISVAATDVRTGVGVVDALARGPGFLGAERWPTITFTLDRLTRTSASTADIEGRITFRGVTRPIAFAATVVRYGPMEADPTRFEAGFDLLGSIDRTAFGSTGGLPDVGATLPIRIRLLMTSE